MAGSGSRGGEPIYGINVTPLVDVVLVLLIILMVTSSYAVSKSLPLRLPKASTGQSSETTSGLPVSHIARIGRRGGG